MKSKLYLSLLLLALLSGSFFSCQKEFKTNYRSTQSRITQARSPFRDSAIAYLKANLKPELFADLDMRGTRILNIEKVPSMLVIKSIKNPSVQLMYGTKGGKVNVRWVTINAPKPSFSGVIKSSSLNLETTIETKWQGRSHSMVEINNKTGVSKAVSFQSIKFHLSAAEVGGEKSPSLSLAFNKQPTIAEGEDKGSDPDVISPDLHLPVIAGSDGTGGGGGGGDGGGGYTVDGATFTTDEPAWTVNLPNSDIYPASSPASSGYTTFYSLYSLMGNSMFYAFTYTTNPNAGGGPGNPGGGLGNPGVGLGNPEANDGNGPPDEILQLPWRTRVKGHDQTFVKGQQAGTPRLLAATATVQHVKLSGFTIIFAYAIVNGKPVVQGLVTSGIFGATPAYSYLAQSGYGVVNGNIISFGVTGTATGGVLGTNVIASPVTLKGEYDTTTGDYWTESFDYN